MSAKKLPITIFTTFSVAVVVLTVKVVYESKLLDKEEEQQIIEATTVEPVKHMEEYNKSGMLVVPYPDYENLLQAHGFAVDILGDSTKQWFLWRGGMYHTQSLSTQ